MKTLTLFLTLFAVVLSATLQAQGLCGGTSLSYKDQYISQNENLYIVKGDSVQISSYIADSYVCNFSVSSVKIYRDSVLIGEVQNSNGSDELKFWITPLPGHYRIESSVPTHNIPIVNIIYTGTGITEGYVDKLSIYPNPVVSVLMIAGPREQISMLELLDLSGRKIYTTDIIPRQLDLGDLQNGTYMLRMIGKDGKVLTKQIMKVNAN